MPGAGDTGLRRRIGAPACHPVRMDLIVGVLVFIGGLVAKPLTDLATEAVRELIARKRRDQETASVQADKASERCWDALAILSDNLLTHIYRSRAQSRDGKPYPERDERSDLIRTNTAKLGVNLELLHVEARESMRLVVDLLRRVDGIDSDSRSPYAHYDPAATIIDETLVYGRRVLGASLRHEKIPLLSPKVLEYSLALDDEDEFWADEMTDPYTEAAYGHARDAWRTAHQDILDLQDRA